MILKRVFGSRWWGETSKIWAIAGPAILTSILQFTIGFVTVVFVGHVGKIELAAISIAQYVVEGFAFGIMLGMGSALETLCGQAVGAGKLDMLGVYLQRSWIITLGSALLLLPFYACAYPILRLLHQTDHISRVAAKYCVWIIPQLFAYAVNFPIQKFFQAQSKVWVMTAISALALGLHVLMNWVFVTKLGCGVVGAALVGNISWWLIIIAQLLYLAGGFFSDAWTGLSLAAFHSLASFVKLSLSSALMLCLELWYYTAMVLLVGTLKNAELSVDAISICMNLEQWTLMVALGFNAAVSVRVSNELGAGRPNAAKFSVAMAVFTSLSLGLLFIGGVIISRTYFPKIFTDDPAVVKETTKLGYLLAATILLNSIQPVLSGVAVGAGWQSLVAMINIGCYYLLGLPVGVVLGFKLKLNVLGIWSGMLMGTFLQTVILMFITFRTNWAKEALRAEERIGQWGGGSRLTQD